MPELPTPKRLGGKTANENQRRGRAHEHEAAGRLGGKLVRGSGAGRVKGDVRRMGVFRLEAKTTKNKSYSLTADMIRKVEASVPAGGTEIPFMEVRVDDASADPKTVFVFPSWAGPIIAEALAAAGDRT